ncbi:hypothetical protein IQ06DRAFT_66175 [Phaeosphaeriaceae sp. SRC1lsM3a]|nr:hypothetical protein IQ06DRAFT_66175 [Stagonospora sp. SRC1lsM3a]
MLTECCKVYHIMAAAMLSASLLASATIVKVGLPGGKTVKTLLSHAWKFSMPSSLSSWPTRPFSNAPLGFLTGLAMCQFHMHNHRHRQAAGLAIPVYLHLN